MEKRNTFKYEVYLQEVREIHGIECPVEDAESRNIEAFRWVNEPMTEENFFPTRVLDELKEQDIRTFPDGDNLNCLYHALSLYITKKQAIKRFSSFSERMQKKLGYTHLASGVIEENYGECTNADKIGHFSFFEYDGIILENKFKIISEL